MVFSFKLPPLIMQLYRVNIIRCTCQKLTAISLVMYYLFRFSEWNYYSGMQFIETYYLTSLVGGGSLHSHLDTDLSF